MGMGRDVEIDDGQLDQPVVRHVSGVGNHIQTKALRHCVGIDCAVKIVGAFDIARHRVGCRPVRPGAWPI